MYDDEPSGATGLCAAPFPPHPCALQLSADALQHARAQLLEATGAREALQQQLQLIQVCVTHCDSCRA